MATDLAASAVRQARIVEFERGEWRRSPELVGPQQEQYQDVLPALPEHLAFPEQPEPVIQMRFVARPQAGAHSKLAAEAARVDSPAMLD